MRKGLIALLTAAVLFLAYWWIFMANGEKEIARKTIKTPHFFSPNLKKIRSRKKKRYQKREVTENEILEKGFFAEEVEEEIICDALSEPLSNLEGAQDSLNLNDLYEIGDFLNNSESNEKCSHVLAFSYLKLADLFYNLGEINSFEEYIGNSLFAIQEKNNLEFVEKWAYRMDSPEAIDTINDLVFEISLIKDNEQELFEVEEDIDYLLEDLANLYVNSLIEEFELKQGQIFEL